MKNIPILPIAVAAVMMCAGLAPLAGRPVPPPPGGDALFKQRCAMCHAVAPGAKGIGPNLRGVVGRRAGSQAGFAYSPAMIKLGKPWTPAQLDAYLAAPQKMVPGSRMVLAVPAPADRAAIVAYMATLK